MSSTVQIILLAIMILALFYTMKDRQTRKVSMLAIALIISQILFYGGERMKFVYAGLIFLGAAVLILAFIFLIVWVVTRIQEWYQDRKWYWKANKIIEKVKLWLFISFMCLAFLVVIVEGYLSALKLF